VWARLLLGSKSYRSLDEIVRSTSVGSKRQWDLRGGRG
jgi:hypothetical protein